MAWELLQLLLALALAWVAKWVSKSSCSDLVRHCESQGIPRLSTIQPRDLLERWETLSSLKHKLFFVALGRDVKLVVSDPALVAKLLMDNADCYCKSSFVKVLEIFGNGLFSSCGDDWSRQRQLLSPYFLTNHIKAKIETMVACATSAAENLVRNGRLEVNVHNLVLELTLDILNRTAFQAAEIRDNSSDILRALSRYHHHRRALAVDATFPGSRFLLQRFQTADSGWLTSMMSKVIEQRRQSNRPQNLLLLDILLDASKTESITQRELLDNCMTFLLAGHETTASLLTWTFYLLGVHPTWQERARAEVSEFIQPPQLITFASLAHLKTLAAILWETLRLFPPQPLIGRSCIKANELGSYDVPAGLEVLVPIASLHRNEEFWGPDANEFRPARFSNGIKNACNHRFAFQPFGTGPRTCIGQALALAEAKVVLTIFLSRFTWQISPEYFHSPDVTLTLQPKLGMPVKFTPLT